MNMKLEIEPTPFIVPTRFIHSFEIQVINLTLFQSVTVMVILYDENDCLIDNKILNISGDDYLDWSNDDNWLIDHVLLKLNLTKLNLSESQNTNI